MVVVVEAGGGGHPGPDHCCDHGCCGCGCGKYNLSLRLVVIVVVITVLSSSSLCHHGCIMSVM